jgi:Bax protein
MFQRLPAAIAVLLFITGLGAFVLLLRHATPEPVPPPPPVVLPPPTPTETAEQIVERKRLFIALLLPVVQAENRRLLQARERISRIEHELANDDDIGKDDFDWLKQTAGDYELDPKARRNSEFFHSLRSRVDVVPASLLIAQAALESGWGRSQVTRENNNFFGHYCYGKGCGVPAPGAGDLRKFDSVEESVRAYIHNLNSHPAYRQLRKARLEARGSREAASGSQLARHIKAYSERGDAYVADVLALIRANRLDDLPDT